MKNKLLKTTFLFALATPICISLASCNTTSIEVKTETKTDNKVDVKTSTNTVTNLTATKTFVTFNAGTTGATITGATLQAGIVGKPFCTVHQPTATLESRQQNYWVYGSDIGTHKKGDRVRDLDPIVENMVVTPYFESDVILRNCLTLVALEHSMVSISNYGGNNPDIHYSEDGFSWKELQPGTILSVLPNKAVYLKGNNPNGFSQSETKYTNISVSGSVNVLGNVMTLVDDGKGTTTEIPSKDGSTHCFAKLFENSTGVRVISSDFLPATTLKPYCYEAMFKGCSTLNDFPSYMLAAQTLSPGCYKEMFSGCTTLSAISPSLLTTATTLADDCYYQMFKGCTGLTALESAVLPNTTLAKGCFTGMFQECAGLTTLPNELLPVTALKEECYYGMFASCTSLTNLSSFVLPATDLTNGINCYCSMFYNCSGLTQAPALPATTLESGCYWSMFYNCKQLTTAPTLAATTMKEDCYNSMFYGTGLTTIPTLPAGDTTGSLAKNCYKDMFRNCKSIGAAVRPSLPAKTLATRCYETMFYNSNLTLAPTISATTLADYCCYKMFYKCTSLTSSSALAATVAATGCYREMYGYCDNLTAIGNISLTSLANFACRQMFDYCKNVTIGTSSTGSTKFFTCPSTIGFEDPVDNMFQNTKGKEETGYTPTAGSTYYYS